MILYHHHLSFTHLTVYYFYYVILRHINISEQKEMGSKDYDMKAHSCEYEILMSKGNFKVLNVI